MEAFSFRCNEFGRAWKVVSDGLVTTAFINAYGQQDLASAAVPYFAKTSSRSRPTNSIAKMDQRAFSLLADYKTADALQAYARISSKQTIIISAKHSFDWTLPLGTAFYIGSGQLSNRHHSVGQPGYERSAFQIGTEAIVTFWPGVECNLSHAGI